MANTENFTVTKGSYGYNLNFTLKDSAGTARNMTGYSAKLQVWAPLAPGTLLIDSACSWTDITAGTLYYTVTNTNFTSVGVYQYCIKAYTDTIVDLALSGFITVTQYGGNYCTLEEIKSELNIDDNDEDDIIQRMIIQSKSAIDDYCHRKFDTETATKYYDGDSVLFIDDLVSVTTLQLDEDGDGTYEATLATTDYILYPRNEYPKTYIKINPNGNYGGFASDILDGVKIIGTWGYASTVPEPVRRAAIIQTCRYFKRRESAYADVIGSAETGTMTVYKGLDPDVELLLNNPYRKTRIG
jgi:hypothetical protein